MAPTLTTTFHDASPTTVEDHFARRDSRVVEFHSVIPEEDESVGTASEPAEPVTPSSDIAPSQHPLHRDANGEHERRTAAVKIPPTSAASTATRNSLEHVPGKVTPSKPNGHTATSTTNAPSEKQGLGKRVGSFVRNKLHRTPSHHKDGAQQPVLPNEPALVKTGVDGPAEVSSPSVNIPKYKRLSSFSLSARSTPRSSHGHSPPSPGSPTSTVSRDHESVHDNAFLRQHKHSSSSTAISSMDRSAPGVTWATGAKDSKFPRFGRRRSVSSEPVAKPPPEDNTIGLIDTFSKPAAHGVGLKARRLSLNLPDEFVVDSCELEKEYKSSSLMPGKRGKVLGKGATSEVRIMARKGTFGHEELVAVKEFRLREKDEDEDDYTDKIKSEFSIAKSLHHPNIVETVRLCTNRGRWNHVMEFCSHGELFTLVERKLFSAGQEGFYTVQDRLCFFKQLLRGVDYLHSHGIAHRDIKLENLLLSKEGHLKISDFGVAEVFCGEHPGMRTAGGECGKNMGEIRLSKPGVCGSLPYIAPEVLEKKGDYDPRPLDIWSCAIVFLTMTFGGCPWQAAKPEYEYYARYKKGWDNWLPLHPDGQIFDGVDGHPKCGKLFSLINPPPVKRLLLRMLHPLPDKRITIRQVITSNCIKGINCCCPESFEDPAHNIDTSKAISKNSSRTRMPKQFLHHHIPPAPEKKINKMLTHRFDMGE